MSLYLKQLQDQIEPLRQQIINHPVYAAIQDLEDLKIFMKYHVYAVWDFMSLLKTLQNNLTCTRVPWFPVGQAETRYLINEIVAGEEADVDQFGTRKSHFELYLDAMVQSGADTNPILNFVNHLKGNGNLESALHDSKTPTAAREFINYTFEVIGSQKDYLQAAIFTFGREDLIPGMFMSMINKIDENFPGNISIFKYYIERHIEVDGDHHSHHALQMTSNLCTDQPLYWQQATQATLQSLTQRIKLWDGVYHEIISRKKPVA
jgi:hypothetical protein